MRPHVEAFSKELERRVHERRPAHDEAAEAAEQDDAGGEIVALCDAALALRLFAVARCRLLGPLIAQGFIEGHDPLP